jgi:N,N'-diacetylchitobiose transport system permease protein
MTKRRIRRIWLNLLGLVVFVSAVFPVYWMVTTGFKPSNEIFTTDFIPFPRDPTLDHVDRVFGSGVAGNSIWVYLGNSLIVALAAVAVSGLFALLGATAIARYRFRGRSAYLILLLVIQMIPGEAMVIPLYVMLVRLGMTDQLLGLVLVNAAAALPFGIWMLRTFVAAVPLELEEAAWIDGASRWKAYWRVVFPLMAPGLVATSIFSFITAWNEFVFALTLIRTQSKYTMPVALNFFISQRSTDIGAIMAASTLMTIPVVIFFLIVQRRLVSGLVAGAVKG